jgi:hypothetical protein
VVRGSGHKWCLSVALMACGFAAKACLLHFDDYAEADLCDAGRDAGIDLRSANDPALRGCDAGPVPKDDAEDASESRAGASGAGGAP